VKTTSTALPEPIEEILADERRALEHQRLHLVSLYPNQYVALSGGHFIDHDPDDEVLAARMYKKLGNKPFYIARLEDQTTVYDLPSPEISG